MKRKGRKNKFDKWFLISWRKLWVIVVSWFVFVLLHNLISALLGFEEALFFILAIFVMPVYFLVVLIYSLVRKIFK